MRTAPSLQRDRELLPSKFGSVEKPINSTRWLSGEHTLLPSKFGSVERRQKLWHTLTAETLESMPGYGGLESLGTPSEDGSDASSIASLKDDVVDEEELSNESDVSNKFELPQLASEDVNVPAQRKVCRPAPLTLKPASLTSPLPTFDTPVITGSPKRLKAPLADLINGIKKKDLVRTIAIWDITKISGGDATDLLRGYLQQYGRVDGILQLDIPSAPGLALVNVGSASIVSNILAKGELHSVHNSNIYVRSLTQLLSSIGVDAGTDGLSGHSVKKSSSVKSSGTAEALNCKALPAKIDEHHQTESKTVNCLEGRRMCRPPPLALKPQPLVSGRSAYETVVVTGSPRRLKDSLTAIISRAKKSDLARTLAVWDITKLNGGDATKTLRGFLENYGRVGAVLEPRIASAPGLALVKMESVASAEDILRAGDLHFPNGATIFTCSVTELMADTEKNISSAMKVEARDQVKNIGVVKISATVDSNTKVEVQTVSPTSSCLRDRRPGRLSPLNFITQPPRTTPTTPYETAVLTGSLRRLRDPLLEVTKRSRKTDLARMLAVWDITKLTGDDATKTLRGHLEKYGHVDAVLEPRIASAPGLAIVKMDSAATVDEVLAAGEIRLPDGASIFARRLADLLADTESKCIGVEEHRKNPESPISTPSAHPLSSDESDEEAAKSFEQPQKVGRPAPLTWKPQPRVLNSKAAYDSAVVTGSPRRIHDPLKAACTRLNKSDFPRTLAVWGITKFTEGDDTEALRGCLEEYGRVDAVLQPHIAAAPGLALVRMESAAVAKGILAAGELGVPGMFVRSLEQLLSESKNHATLR